jgi:hypothetical protein
MLDSLVRVSRRVIQSHYANNFHHVLWTCSVGIPLIQMRDSHTFFQFFSWPTFLASFSLYFKDLMPSLVEHNTKMSSDAAKFPQLMKDLESKIDEVQNQLKPILQK